MRQLPHTDVKYCMAFSFVEDISFWTFASHQSDCHWLLCLSQEKNEDFTSSLSSQRPKILDVHNVMKETLEKDQNIAKISCKVCIEVMEGKLLL